MGVRLSVLASGSSGNCTVVSSAGTRVLVDCGLSCREIFRRMRVVGETPESLDALVISHEHCDHIHGLWVLARKLNIPVYISEDTHEAWKRQWRAKVDVPVRLPKVEHFRPGVGFQIGDIGVLPFTIPHDSVDPVGFTFQVKGCKLGIVTDLGYMPANVNEAIRGCQVLMIESNHDLEMLRVGPYPWHVKQRVMSKVGHLSNEALAQFFSSSYDGAAAVLVLAHISEQNNHPEIARATAERALGARLGRWQNRLMIASQALPLDPICL